MNTRNDPNTDLHAIFLDMKVEELKDLQEYAMGLRADADQAEKRKYNPIEEDTLTIQKAEIITNLHEALSDVLHDEIQLLSDQPISTEEALKEKYSAVLEKLVSMINATLAQHSSLLSEQRIKLAGKTGSEVAQDFLKRPATYICSTYSAWKTQGISFFTNTDINAETRSMKILNFLLKDWSEKAKFLRGEETQVHCHSPLL